VVIVVVVALIFDFTNGFYSARAPWPGRAPTGALEPRTAVTLAARLNLSVRAYRPCVLDCTTRAAYEG
jgi:PiT family inorganic phosphate transporter